MNQQFRPSEHPRLCQGVWGAKPPKNQGGLGGRSPPRGGSGGAKLPRDSSLNILSFYGDKPHVAHGPWAPWAPRDPWAIWRCLFCIRNSNPVYWGHHATSARPPPGCRGGGAP